MTPAEYLDAAKQRLGIESDYELAKRMDERRENLPSMRTGKRAIPLHLVYWLAITLELDPATVAADLESQREKNEKRKAFWASFLSRAACLIALCCTLGLATSGSFGSALGANGGRYKRPLRFA